MNYTIFFVILIMVFCIVISGTIYSYMKSGCLEESSFELTKDGIKLYMKGKQEKNDSNPPE